MSIKDIDYGTPARDSATLVTLDIDGRTVTVPEGTSVMRAAMEAGITVPKLCATDHLEAFGSCRLCMVEIEGRRGTPASCTTPVAPGMKVHTQNERLGRLRRGVMELYISDHPLDCLTCPANGNCELQDMAGAVGLRDVRYGFSGENHLSAQKDESNPYFTFDPSKCIVCSRCVRACGEVQGTFALTIDGRGFDSKVSPGALEQFMDSECVSCGACVQACPTATLSEKSLIELGQPEHSVITTCAYCGVGCSFKAEMKGTTVVRMVPHKDGGANELLSKESSAYSWLRHTIEALSEGDNPEEFLEHTKLELFQDQVFCFTPKGKLIALPRGATPIDFAYAVHTNIGDTTVGAKINGRIMPLVTRLNNGDEVEIIRSGVQVPPAAWEEIVVTGKARAAIRRATRMAIRKQYAGLGYRILERTFDRAGKIFSREGLKPALHRLGQKDVEDAIAAVGRGELSSLDVMRAVYPDYKDERVTVKPSTDEGWFNVRSVSGMMFRVPSRSAGDAGSEGHERSPVPIRGLSSNMQVKFAPNGAVPGDRIVGIMEEGGRITIYPIQAPALQHFDDQPERWIDVRWDLDDDNKSRFTARILMNALNEPGTLATVAQTIAGLDINIRNLDMGRVAADFSEIVIDVEVWDLRQLNQLLTQLKDLDCISTVKRLYD